VLLSDHQELIAQGAHPGEGTDVVSSSHVSLGVMELPDVWGFQLFAWCLIGV
jgi:hypothetical protein